MTVKMVYIKMTDKIDDGMLKELHQMALDDEIQFETEKEGNLETVTYNSMFDKGVRVDFDDGISIVYINDFDIPNLGLMESMHNHIIILKENNND